MFKYDRDKLEIGFLHFGLGGFHRAHQAVFIDDAISKGNLGLGIASISQRDPSLADEMNRADSIYEVEESDGHSSEIKSIGSIKESLFYPRDENRIIEIAKSPNLKAITLTVTEKAYKPGSDFSLRLAKVLQSRYEVNGSSIAVISCDNLPSNGNFVRELMKTQIDDPLLWKWVEENVRFPNCMVDRIVPAPDKSNRLLIKTERFNQWIIENDPISNYLAGSGVQFVADVKPYELAKIRLFNGVHSYLAYYGQIHGIEYIADVISKPEIKEYVKQMQEEEIIKTLKLNIDLKSYASEIRSRMANESLHHKTLQIAMDGSQKLPQRMIGTLNDLAGLKIPAPKMLNALATWIKYLQVSDSINDPLSSLLKPLAVALDIRGIAQLLSSQWGEEFDSEIRRLILNSGSTL